MKQCQKRNWVPEFEIQRFYHLALCPSCIFFLTSKRCSKMLKTIIILMSLISFLLYHDGPFPLTCAPEQSYPSLRCFCLSFWVINVQNTSSDNISLWTIICEHTQFISFSSDWESAHVFLSCDFFFFLEILTQCLLGVKGHLYHLHLTWKLSCLSYMILDIQFYRCFLLSWWCSLLFPSLSSIFDILCLNISEYVERITLFLMEENIRA